MLARPDIVKDIGRILFWYPFRWCVSRLSFPALYRLGGIIGSLDFRLSSRRRITRMVENVCRGMDGCHNAASTVMENLCNHARNNLELLRYPSLSPASVDEYVLFDRRDILDDELRKGKGVLLATAHFGAKQALQVGLGHKGYRVNQIHFHMGVEELSVVQRNVSQRLRKKIEERIPVNFLAAEGFMRTAFKCLKKGEILIVAGDGIGLKSHMNESYEPFDFLGQKMMFPMGMASLAKRTGAGIIPVFAIREGARHRLVFEAVIDSSREIKATMIEYIRVLERYVRQYPALWEFWEEFNDENLLSADQTRRVTTKDTK